jgi:O-antigen/teichoic acid export membrane protein
LNYSAADKKLVTKGFLWNAIGQAADVTSALYLYFARYLFGGNLFGVFSIAYSLTELFNRFLIGGYGDAATYFASKHLHAKGEDAQLRERLSYESLAHCLFIPFLISLIACLILGYGSEILYQRFWSNHPRILKDVLIGLSFLLPLKVLVQIPLEAVKAHLDMRWSVWIMGGILPLGNVLFTLGFYFLGYGLWSLVYGQILANVIGMVGAFYGFTRYFKIRLLFRHLLGGIFRKDIHAFAIPQSINMLMNYGLVRMDTLMLSVYLNVNEIGIYTLLSEFTRSMRSAKTSFSKIFSPLVAKYQGMNNRLGIQEALQSVSYWTATLSTPFLFGILWFYSDVILGPGHNWLYSPYIAPLLCVGPMLSCYWGLSGNLLLMSGHSTLLLMNSALLFGLNLGLNLLFIPAYGMMGAALATAISSFGISTLQMAEMWYFQKIKFSYKISFRVMLPSILLAVPPILFYSEAQTLTLFLGVNLSSFGFWGIGSLKLGLLFLTLSLFGAIQYYWPGNDSLRYRFVEWKKTRAAAKSLG